MRIVRIELDHGLCDECFTNDNPAGEQSQDLIYAGAPSQDGFRLCHKHWLELMKEINAQILNR